MNSAYGKSKNNDINYKIHATKNFLLLQHENSEKNTILKIFNITDMGYEEQQDQQGFEITIQENKISNNSKFLYAVQKNNLYSSFITVIETDSFAKNSQFNLHELVVPQKAQSDFFSNMRFPMFFFLKLSYISHSFKKNNSRILLSIIFAVGYQIWNRRKTNKSNEYDKLEGLKV